MKNLLLAAVTLIMALAGCATPHPPGAKQYHEKSLQTEYGPLHLTDFALYPDTLGTRVKGNVKNESSKDWLNAQFEIKVFDSKAKLLGSKTVFVSDLKKGSVRPIEGVGELFGLTISTPKEARVSSFDIQFVRGTYPADYIFTMTKPVESKTLNFNDKEIEIQFALSANRINFALSNKTNNPIKIDWNNVAFVDFTGETQKVIHSGVKLIDKEKPQGSSIVPPQAKLTDGLLPASYVASILGTWIEQPIFPNAPYAKEYKGKSFAVLLPMEVNGKIKNYHFIFKIDDIVM